MMMTTSQLMVMTMLMVLVRLNAIVTPTQGILELELLEKNKDEDDGEEQ